jgi:hypothetical protein
MVFDPGFKNRNAVRPGYVVNCTDFKPFSSSSSLLRAVTKITGISLVSGSPSAPQEPGIHSSPAS